MMLCSALSGEGECEQNEQERRSYQGGVLLFGRGGEQRKHNIEEEKRGEEGEDSSTFSRATCDAGLRFYFSLTHPQVHSRAPRPLPCIQIYI